MNLERRKFLKILLLGGAVLAVGRVIKLDRTSLVISEKGTSANSKTGEVGRGKAKAARSRGRVAMAGSSRELAFIDKESGEKILVLEK